MGMDIYGSKSRNKDGEYFRANVWTWRPIHFLCDESGTVDTTGWERNDGCGLKTQAECDVLADALEGMLPELEFSFDRAFFGAVYAPFPPQPCDAVDEAKSAEEFEAVATSFGDNIAELIPASDPGGPALRTTTGAILFARKSNQSPYFVSKAKLEAFISFLHGCGGFEIH